MRFFCWTSDCIGDPQYRRNGRGAALVVAAGARPDEEGGIPSGGAASMGGSGGASYGCGCRRSFVASSTR